jgi:hypothetical protein
VGCEKGIGKIFSREEWSRVIGIRVIQCIIAFRILSLWTLSPKCTSKIPMGDITLLVQGYLHRPPMRRSYKAGTMPSRSRSTHE